jgi:hypothetical protein
MACAGTLGWMGLTAIEPAMGELSGIRREVD